MANATHEKREITKRANESEIIIDKMKRGEELTQTEIETITANFIFGHIQFKLLEKEYKDYHSTIKSYLKDHGKRFQARHPLFCLEWQERSRGRTPDTEWLLDRLSHEDLKEVLLNSKVSWNKKVLASIIPQNEIDAHSTEQTAEYLVPRIRKDKRIDWDEEDKKLKPVELRLNNKYVKKLIQDNSPRLLMDV
nr:MAG: hypothetical protein [Lokiarchaeota virus Ratatoskr Meg22_1012]